MLTDKTSERAVRDYTLRWVLALCLLSGGATVRWARDLDRIRDDGVHHELIDRAGRQRMLSQRIGFTALQLITAEDRAPLRRELEDAADEMALAHALLVDDPPEELRELYFGGRLDDRVRAFVEDAHRLAALPVPPSFADVEPLTQGASGPLLADLEDAVSRYEALHDAWRYHTFTVSTAAWVGVLGLLAAIGLGVFKPMAEAMRREAERLAGVDAERQREADRARFAGQLQAGLDMAETEADALRALGRALDAVAPSAQLLLADASQAHLSPAATSETRTSPACSVSAPFQCPAVRRGHSLSFATSTDLGACPRLAERGEACSALCVPVTFMGSAVGVLHATGPAGQPFEADVVDRMEVVAAMGANRLGTLRTFARVELQAQTDALTGLLNRRALEARAQALRHRGVPHVVVVADVDHFKRLNDTFGHDTGDRALQVFAKAMVGAVRSDDFVARLGGEEFVLVLVRASVDEACVVVERLRSHLASLLAGSNLPRFTASFGVAEASGAPTFDDAVRAADIALLQAKSAGRDRIVRADAPMPLAVIAHGA